MYYDIAETNIYSGEGTATIIDKPPPFTIQKNIEISKDTNVIRVAFSKL